MNSNNELTDSASAADGTEAEAASLTEPDAEEVTLKKCKEIFQKFDRGAGNILTKDVGSALRALSQIPSESEIEMIVSKLEQSDIYDKGETRLSFQDFYQVVMENSERKADIREMVMDSFKLMDREGTGFVDVAQLSSVLTTIGETLTSAEMRELLADAGVSKEGKVDYAKFIDTVLSVDLASADNNTGSNSQGKLHEVKTQGRAAALAGKRK